MFLANVIKSSNSNGIEISTKLKNGYCDKELFDIIYSFKSLNSDERTLLHCYLTLFIGLENSNSENIIKVNRSYIADKIGHVIHD